MKTVCLAESLPYVLFCHVDGEENPLLLIRMEVDHTDGIHMPRLILSTIGIGEEHLEMKYMKEVVETASIISALMRIEMTWGVTSYYRQEIDYDRHINFLEKCLDVVKSKKEEMEYVLHA